MQETLRVDQNFSIGFMIYKVAATSSPRQGCLQGQWCQGQRQRSSKTKVVAKDVQDQGQVRDIKDKVEPE